MASFPLTDDDDDDAVFFKCHLSPKQQNLKLVAVEIRGERERKREREREKLLSIALGTGIEFLEILVIKITLERLRL